LLWFFLNLFLAFAALYLRDASADRRETFTYDWKCGHLEIVGPKFWNSLKTLGGKWFMGKISKPHWPIAK